MPHLELHMNWSMVKADFGRDGSLRDLYVYETSIADWEAFLSSLSSWPYEVRFFVNGEESDAPATAADAFRIGAEAALTLRVNVKGVSVCTHFFVPEEIELDVDPREIDGPEKLKALSQFIRELGQALDRVVEITHENSPELVIARFLPSTGEFSYPGAASNPGAA